MDIKGIKKKIEAGDIEGAKSMIEEHSDRINQPNQGKETCLMLVSYERNPVLINLLIDAGADLEMTDSFGSTALHYAVLGRQLQAVNILKCRGSDVNVKNKFGWTPLHLAAKGHKEWKKGVAALLETENIKVNQQDIDGCTPLYYACNWGYTDTVQLLLKHTGIEVNLPDKYGDTPLHLAVREQHYAVVTLMLSQESVNFEMVNNKNRTPLLEAVSGGHLGIMQKVIARGANVKVVDNEGNNCLHLALQTDVFDSEVEHMDILDKYAFKLFLDLQDRTCSVVVASYLFHFGANFYQKNMENKTPLELIMDENLKEKLTAILPPLCTYCKTNFASKFRLCQHSILCSECQSRIKCETCPTCQQPVFGQEPFETQESQPKYNRKKVTCKQLSDAIPTGGKKFRKVSEPIPTTSQPVAIPTGGKKFRKVSEPIPTTSQPVETQESQPKYNRKKVKCKQLSDAIPTGGKKFRKVSEPIPTTSQPVGSPNLGQKHLHNVAMNLGSKWQQVGRELGIEQVELDIIQHDYPYNVREQSFQMLYKWFRSCDPAKRTLGTLKEALKKMECFDALEHLSSDVN